jgi:hypothetical protein
MKLMRSAIRGLSVPSFPPKPGGRTFLLHRLEPVEVIESIKKSGVTERSQQDVDSYGG